MHLNNVNFAVFSFRGAICYLRASEGTYDFLSFDIFLYIEVSYHIIKSSIEKKIFFPTFCCLIKYDKMAH